MVYTPPITSDVVRGMSVTDFTTVGHIASFGGVFSISHQKRSSRISFRFQLGGKDSTILIGAFS